MSAIQTLNFRLETPDLSMWNECEKVTVIRIYTSGIQVGIGGIRMSLLSLIFIRPRFRIKKLVS